LYVDNLIGPATVNTMPEATLRAFEEHGTLHRTVDADPDAPGATLDRLHEAGVDMLDVEQTLEDEGVHAFVKSYEELLQSLSDKAATF
jgi:transaldolase